MEQSEHRKKSNILRGLWEAWKRLGRRIADIQVRVLLSLFYFVIFAPFALAVRWGTDPLTIKAHRSRGWQPINITENSSIMDEARRQF